MSEMIERVARRLDPLAWAALGLADTEKLAFRRGRSRELAVVAMEAIREMVPVVKDHEGFPAHQLVGAPEDIWRTMIDAALTQEK